MTLRQPKKLILQQALIGVGHQETALPPNNRYLDVAQVV